MRAVMAVGPNAERLNYEPAPSLRDAVDFTYIRPAVFPWHTRRRFGSRHRAKPARAPAHAAAEGTLRVVALLVRHRRSLLASIARPVSLIR